MIDDFGVISAKRTFKRYSREQRFIKLIEFISPSKVKPLSGRFPFHCTETFEGIKRPHQKPDCLDCDNRKTCSDCVIKPEKNCFN